MVCYLICDLLFYIWFGSLYNWYWNNNIKFVGYENDWEFMFNKCSMLKE